MTGKKLLSKLQQEQFDVKGFDVVIDIGDGMTATITGVELDENERQIRLILDGDEDDEEI